MTNLFYAHETGFGRLNNAHVFGKKKESTKTFSIPNNLNFSKA